MVSTRRQAAQSSVARAQETGKPDGDHVHNASSTYEKANLLEELGVDQSVFVENMSAASRCSRFVSRLWLRLNIRIGSYLLTPTERLIYLTAIVLLLVLVLVGFVKSTWFYFHSIGTWSHNLLQQGWSTTWQQFFVGMDSAVR